MTWFDAARIPPGMMLLAHPAPRTVAALLPLGLAFLLFASALSAMTTRAEASKLKVPRFVSLRFATVNLRAGPGTQYPINWRYKRRGMPIEVIRDLENWRRVRDRWGTVGWIHVSNLSGKRTVLIDRASQVLRDAPEAKAKPVARARPGVVADLERCRKDWCRISAAGHTGWVRRSGLWGLYPKEKID